MRGRRKWREQWIEAVSVLGLEAIPTPTEPTYVFKHRGCFFLFVLFATLKHCIFFVLPCVRLCDIRSRKRNTYVNIVRTNIPNMTHTAHTICTKHIRMHTNYIGSRIKKPKDVAEQTLWIVDVYKALVRFDLKVFAKEAQTANDTDTRTDRRTNRWQTEMT